ncbi:MAG: hypothetical protein LQ338_005709 [Usnochroma carphineum]|nr:MAG: hypothetical protein LQ338_005709 [Usnochroma carphineum]
MTPQFYARYVPITNAPTPAKAIDDLEASRPAKKRRRKHDENIGNDSVLKGIGLNENPGPVAGSSISDVGKARSSGVKSKAPSGKLADGVRSSNQDQEEPFRGSVRRIDGVRNSSPKTDGISSSSFDKERSRNGLEQPSADVGKERKKQKKKHVGRTQTGSVKDAATDGHGLALGNEDQNIDGSKHLKVLSKYQKSVAAAASSVGIEENTKDIPNSPAASPETHGLTPIPQPPQVPDAARPSAFAALPSWLTEPVVAASAEAVAFDTLRLDPSILKALRARGFTEAFTIQAAVLPLLLPGEQQHHGDLCISASTGSGKTLAYALPMVEALRDKPIRRLRGLVVVPTRELVNQARETLELCGAGSGLEIGTAYGSKTLRQEQEALITRQYKYDPEAYQREQEREIDHDEELLKWDSDGFEDDGQAEVDLTGYVVSYTSRVDVLVCTPGRLIEHLQHTRGFTLDHVQWLVIDEADRLLDESFQQWVEVVVPALEHQSPPGPLESQMMERYHLLRRRNLRKIILSATMTRDISKLKELKLRRPKLVVLKGEREPPQTDGEEKDQVPKVESTKQFELPSTLQEAAVQVKDEENKPLYLIELLNQLSSTHLPTSNQTHRRRPNDMIDSSASDSSDSSDDDDSKPSNFTSSASSPSASTSPVSDSQPYLSQMIHQPNASANQIHGSLIFTHSTASAHRLSRLLSILAPSQASTTATMTKSSAKSSKRIFSQFRAGNLTTIISTDRASRGLDIPDLAHVINYDMPPSVHSYIHRVGRTARAGKAGTAITLVGWREGRWFWNEIGRGSGIERGGKKITRRSIKDGGWDDGELQRYAHALKQLGEETRGEHQR